MDKLDFVITFLEKRIKENERLVEIAIKERMPNMEGFYQKKVDILKAAVEVLRKK